MLVVDVLISAIKSFKYELMTESADKTRDCQQMSPNLIFFKININQSPSYNIKNKHLINTLIQLSNILPLSSFLNKFLTVKTRKNLFGWDLSTLAIQNFISVFECQIRNYLIHNMQEDTYPQVLWLGSITYSNHQISMIYGLDKMRFTCSIWLSDVDLLELEDKFSKTFLDKVLFHLLCFEANKLCSLKPKYLDLGEHAQHWNEDFEKIWRQVFYRVWGQWRYTHNIPNYRGPQVKDPKQYQQKIGPITIKQGPVKNLCFFGGGKDSLASTTLLDNIGQNYEILTYTNSIYGSAPKQIEIISRLIKEAVHKKYYYTYVYDDFVNCPILEIEKTEIKELLAAETPSSIFLSLLFVLSKGYTSIILGHEKSADTGNLIWNNEDINHQWGKSTQAEKLLREYIQKELISNLTYYSILKPLYDTSIIIVTSTRQNYIHLTHSCNIDKPWCMKCPKCCYVWLLYMAYMDIQKINKMFDNKNLLDLPENHFHFRELLGLEQHTPFECIGRPEEVRICFELLRIKGVKGKAMDDFLEIENEDYVKLFQNFSSINEDYNGFPADIRDKYYTQVKRIVNVKKMQIKSLLQKGKFIPKK